jgi:hypothetical protein
MVLDATQGAFYGVDPATGLALPTTDPDTGITTNIAGDALTKATCIQAAAWITLNIDPYAGGLISGSSRVKTSSKLGSASIQYADGADLAAARARASQWLVPDALRALQAGNLLGTGPWTFG